MPQHSVYFIGIP